MRCLYKLLSRAQWEEFRKLGTFCGADIDLKDGFIHFSYADQVKETAERHFSGMDDLVLIAVDAARVAPALRDEVSRHGMLFPHLYGPLSIADVVWDSVLERRADGSLVFPPLDQRF